MSWFRGRTWWRLDGGGRFGSQRHPLPKPPGAPRPDKKAAQRMVIQDSCGIPVNQSCVSSILIGPDGHVKVTIMGWTARDRLEGADGVDIEA